MEKKRERKRARLLKRRRIRNLHWEMNECGWGFIAKGEWGKYEGIFLSLNWIQRSKFEFESLTAFDGIWIWIWEALSRLLFVCLHFSSFLSICWLHSLPLSYILNLHLHVASRPFFLVDPHADTYSRTSLLKSVGTLLLSSNQIVKNTYRVSQLQAHSLSLSFILSHARNWTSGIISHRKKGRQRHPSRGDTNTITIFGTYCYPGTVANGVFV